MNLPWSELEPSLAEWGVSLDDAQRASLEKYLAFIQETNKTVNVTAEDDDASLLLRHAADGLAAVGLLQRITSSASRRIVDLGSGGGFIGFALKIGWPEADVTLMESLQRKYDVLNRAAVAVGLKGLRPLRARAETTGAPRTYDVVIERALAPLPEAVALAFPMVAPGGKFVAYQTDAPDPKEPALEKALARAGAKLLESWPYRLPREQKPRHLAVFARLEHKGT
jgi:16S rRNA (guanine527-N7)-methyltransferase